MSTTHARKGRQARATALRSLGVGRLSLREVLRDGHDALDSCPIHRVMEATKGLGPIGTQRILERKSIWPLTPLGKLSKRERSVIVYYLPERIL